MYNALDPVHTYMYSYVKNILGKKLKEKSVNTSFYESFSGELWL